MNSDHIEAQISILRARLDSLVKSLHEDFADEPVSSISGSSGNIGDYDFKVAIDENGAVVVSGGYRSTWHGKNDNWEYVEPKSFTFVNGGIVYMVHYCGKPDSWSELLYNANPPKQEYSSTTKQRVFLIASTTETDGVKSVGQHHFGSITSLNVVTCEDAINVEDSD